MTKQLNIVFAADSSQVGKAFSSIEGQASRFGDKLSSGMQKVGIGLTAGLTVPLLAFGATAVKEASEAQVVMGQTEAVIESTGAAAGVTAQQVGTMSNALGNMAGVEGEVVQESSNLLLTFTNVKNGVGAGNAIFNEAQQAILDMGVAMNNGSTEGLDLQAATIQVGKALNDPIKGMTALAKVGVSFTAQQKEQVKAMVEAGDTMGAQKLILAELNREFAGSAKAAGDNLPPFERLKLTLANLAETVGTTILPFVQKFAEKISEWAQKFQELSPAAQGMILKIGLLAAAIGPLLLIGSKVVLMFQMVGTAFRVLSAIFLANPFVLLAAAIIALVALVVMNWDTIKNAIGTAWDWIKAKTAAVWDSIKSFFAEFWPVLIAIFTGGLGLIIRYVISHWDEIKARTAAAWDAVKSAISNAWEAIKSTVASAMERVKTAVSSGFSAVVSFVASVPGKILGALGNLGGLLVGAGRALMTGLLNGIKAAWEAVKDYLSSLANKIKSLKGPIDKDRVLLIPEGEATMEGFMTGLRNKFGPLELMLSSVASKVTAAMNPSAMMSAQGVAWRPDTVESAQWAIANGLPEDYFTTGPQGANNFDGAGMGGGTTVNVYPQGNVMTERDLVDSIEEGMHAKWRAQGKFSFITG